MNREFQEFFLFQIGAVTLGLTMDVVEEVLSRSPVTPVPRTAEFVRGLAAVRGKLMSVIDGGLRLGISGGKENYFVICHVRGNQTAISIERPIEAGSISVSRMSDKEFEDFHKKAGLKNPRLFKCGWKVYEKSGDSWVLSPRAFLEVIVDQFVSDQMASQLLRAG